MTIKNVILSACFPLLLMSNYASASLIGDEVSCFFGYNVFGFTDDGECSIDPRVYRPGTAIVNNAGPSEPEFHLGRGPRSLSFVPVSAVELDVGAQWFTLDPSAQAEFITGDFTLELSSLNWLGSPTSIISGLIVSGVDIDGGDIVTSYSDSAVQVKLLGFSSTANTFIRVDLLTSSNVPGPASLLLLLTGLGVLLRTRGPSASSTQR